MKNAEEGGIGRGQPGVQKGARAQLGVAGWLLPPVMRKGCLGRKPRGKRQPAVGWGAGRDWKVFEKSPDLEHGMKRTTSGKSAQQLNKAAVGEAMPFARRR